MCIMCDLARSRGIDTNPPPRGRGEQLRDSGAKNEEVVQFLDDMSMAAFGTKRSDAIEKGYCARCKADNLRFKDELSKKEFSISGLCQSCQDEVFVESEGEVGEEQGDRDAHDDQLRREADEEGNESEDE